MTDRSCAAFICLLQMGGGGARSVLEVAMAQPERLDTRVFRGLGWKRRTVMMSRRLAIVALSSIAVLSAPVLGWAAEDCVMMDSSPAANAVIARRSSEFFV